MMDHQSERTCYLAFSDSAPDFINVFGFGFFNWYLEARALEITLDSSYRAVLVLTQALLRRLTQLKQYVDDNRANTKTVTYTQNGSNISTWQKASVEKPSRLVRT